MRIERFLSEQLRLTETSRAAYGHDLRAFQNFTRCEEPTREAVLGYVAELRRRGRGDSHISRVLYAIKRYCSWAHLDVFGSGGVEIPGFEFGEPREVLTEDDVLRLLEASETPLERALVTFLFDTGCRIGELLRLKANDVDWEQGIVWLTRKGRRQRREAIALFPETLTFLKEYRDWSHRQTGDLFPHQYADLRIWMLALAKRAGVRFPRHSLFHALRHARATSMRLSGVPLEDISNQLGHLNISTTLRIYARFAPTQLRDRIHPPPWSRRK